MNNQPSLFDPPPLKTAMAPTSLDAYEGLTNSGKKLTQRQTVLEYIRINPGCTRQWLVTFMGKPINVICGRVYELVKSGEIIEHGTFRNRKKLWPITHT